MNEDDKDEEDNFPEVNVTLSPTSLLRKRFLEKQQKTVTDERNQPSSLEREIMRYESFTLAPNDVDVLNWWKTHENAIPLLAKLAKHVLTIPASSSKSERVFSCGGNLVTPHRNRLAAKKVEDFVVIKENKSKIEEFKQRTAYKLKQSEKKPFEKIHVDMVLSNLEQLENSDEDDINSNDSFVEEEEVDTVTESTWST